MKAAKYAVPAVALAATGIGFAPPASAGCETQPFAQYCDGPVRPDGSWDRCVVIFGQAGYGTYIPSTSRCYPYDPAAPPPTPLGQPQYHVYP